MIEYDLFARLVTRMREKHVKTMSILVNKILKEAFTMESKLNEKDKIITGLQTALTDIGETRDDYKAQLIRAGKVKE